MAQASSTQTNGAQDTIYDVIIVGAGPAGLGAALNVAEHYQDKSFLLLEMYDHIAHTVFSYLKGKAVKAEPRAVPKLSGLWFEEEKREKILEEWASAVASKIKEHIRINQEVIGVKKDGDIFTVSVKGNRTYQAKFVVLASGTQANPRPLFPNDPVKERRAKDLPNVWQGVPDPSVFKNKDVVVIGAGTSAVEFVINSAPYASSINMVIRRLQADNPFEGANNELVGELKSLAAQSKVTIRYGLSAHDINEKSIIFKNAIPAPDYIEIEYDYVVRALGTLSPRAFLETPCGLAYKGRETPPVSLSYETEVPGLFLVGAVSGRYNLIKHAINQGHEVIEHIFNKGCYPAALVPAAPKFEFLSGATLVEKIAALRSMVPLLKNVSDPDVADLLPFSELPLYKAGDVIENQDAPTNTLLAILEGQVDILWTKSEGELEHVAYRGAGQFVGEMSLVSGLRRSGTIRASAPSVRIFQVERRAMLRLMDKNPLVDREIHIIYMANAFQTRILETIPRPVLIEAASHAKVEDFAKGKAIILQEADDDDFYFISSGSVKVSAKTLSGREIVLGFFSAGDFFGEAAILRGKRRAATVSAVDKVEVFKMARADLQRLMTDYPELDAIIREHASDREIETWFAAVETETNYLVAESKRDLFRQEPVVVGDNVMVIDESRCIHCDNCVKACESVHVDGQSRLKRTGPKVANMLLTTSCAHCENAPCMSDCDGGTAIDRDPISGAVYIKLDACVDCQKCIALCPFQYNFHFDGAPKKDHSLWGTLREALGMSAEHDTHGIKKTPIKCDLCKDVKGDMQACVHSCPTNALTRQHSEAQRNAVVGRILERKQAV